MSDPIADAQSLLTSAFADRVFPAASAEVGSSEGPLWSGALGTLTFGAGAAACTADTLFDLASLTKPIATTSLALDLIARHAMSLDEPLSRIFDEWSGKERAGAVVRDLLEHSSGLPARLIDAPPRTRREFEHEICALPLEYAPRARSIYSDLDFILLGFLVEDRGDATLDRQFAAMVPQLVGDDAPLHFRTAADERSQTAPTLPLPDDARRGRTLIGDVHDNYAAALGGVAGHAGLFGTAAAVGAFARAVLRAARGDRRATAPLSPAVVQLATRKTSVPGSSRALGWDTMLPTSSCGTEVSPAAFGHLGYTGTSLWIDPVLDRYFVLLTNRVCGGGTSEQMQIVRRRFHNVMAKL